MPKIRKNVILKRYTTIGVGGPALFFSKANTIEDMIFLIDWACSNKIPWFVLGSGSNLLVSDNGYKGLVIKNSISGLKFKKNTLTCSVEVGSGLSWDYLVKETLRRKLYGVECLSGIPGTVGGGVVQNIGAYGQEISTSIATVKVFNIRKSRIENMKQKDCEFAYRHSLFKNSQNYIVLSIKLKLFFKPHPKDDDKAYTGLKARKLVLSTRKSKSMLYNKKDINSVSAGSFFLNPVVTQRKFLSLKKAFPDIVGWPIEKPKIKIPAGWLVEHAGFKKGYRHKTAGISAKHALSLINPGNATSKDLFALSEKIRIKVYEKFGIGMQREVILLGF